MFKRLASLLLLPLLVFPVLAKNKKNTMPELILRARYVAVMVDPDAGISVADPAENRIAQTDVEAALHRWGRFSTTMESANADLVLVIRKGEKPVKQTIGNNRNNPPLVNPTSPGDINVGVHMGTAPPLRSDPTVGNSTGQGTEIGPTEDILEVYRGGDLHPLDSAPLWRYAARNGLQHPSVPVIEKFRKAIEDAEKAKP
jgi:hypothetical protein